MERGAADAVGPVAGRGARGAGSVSSAWRGSRTTTPWDGPGADGAPGPRAAVEAGLGAGSLLLTAGEAGDCPMMIKFAAKSRKAFKYRQTETFKKNR